LASGLNTVELLGWYGGDETHALSAWTSTSRELTDEKRGRIDKLLMMLAQSEPIHNSPFEKSYLHFLVTTDIASHIHLIKHRIGVSINAESARYKELKEGKYYLPVDWPEYERDSLESHILTCYKRYRDTLERLEPVLGRKRAKESARFYLPYGIQITADVAFNFSSFVHFQKLRNHPDAQLEIRTIAQTMLDLIHQLPNKPFKFSLEAFNLLDPKYTL